MKTLSANLLILIPNTKVKSYFYLFFTNYYAYRRKTEIWNSHYLLRCGNLRIIEKEFSQNNSEGTPENDFFNFLEPKKRPESSI